MPTVPTYDHLTQGGGAQAPRAFTGSDAPSAGAIGARQAQGLGQAVQGAGEAAARMAEDAARMAEDAQRQANDIRVLDAVNQAKERQFDLKYGQEGYLNAKGIQALQRADGKPLHVEYTTKFDDTTSELAAGLGNDAQREAFARAAQGLRSEIYGDAQRHVASEFRTYQVSVYDGGIANAQRAIATGWQDPKAVEAGAAQIDAAVRAKARALGLSQELADSEARKAVSNAHTLALADMMERSNVDAADLYLKKHAPQMDADDILKVRSGITKEMQQQQAMKAADVAWQQAAPTVIPKDSDRAFNILLGTESRGKQFGADGKPLTSKAGAVGIAQVMEGTGPEAAKLAGVAWDRERWLNDAEYNKALGRAYFEKQLQTFGRLDLAYAAYNAGPGAVRKAMEAAASYRGGMGNWLDHVPKETQAYVTKNMREYGAGAGKPTPATVEDMMAAAEKAMPNASPEQRQWVRAELQRRHASTMQSQKEQDDQATATALQKVAQAGGDLSVLTPSERQAIPGEDLPKVYGFAATLAKREPVQTNLSLYARLSDPSVLKSLSEAELVKLRPELSDSDFKHFSGERAKLLNQKPAGETPGDLNTQAIRSTLDDRMRSLGMDPSPKDATKESAQVGAIRRFINESILSAQAASGKKMTDAEVAAHIDGLFAKSTDFRGWFSTTKGPMLTAKVDDIPAADREAIRGAFKRNGVDDPSDGDVLAAWFHMKNGGARQGGATGSF